MEIVGNQQELSPRNNEYCQINNKNDQEMINLEKEEFCKEVTESTS